MRQPRTPGDKALAVQRAMNIDHPEAVATEPTADAPTTSETSLLAAITAGLATGGDLAMLLQRFLNPIVQLAGAQAGAVRVLSDDGERLQLVSAVGLPAGLREAELAVDRHCGHCGSAADGQPVVWAAELDNCARRSGADYFGQGCRRLLAVPLQHRGRVLGVYNLFFADTSEPSAEVQGLLRSIGDLLGLALNNARLEAEHLRATLAEQRQTMAAEVHDSLGQSLAFVKMRLPLLEDALRAHDETQAQRYCDEVRSAVSEAHANLRSIITHLRTPMDPLGLMHALQGSVDRFRRMGSGTLEFVNELPALKMPAEHEAQVFHLVQEALNNVARHAGASHAWLRIAPAGRGEVQITVDDDGIGPAGAQQAGPSHYGLEVMRERARRIGGRLDVRAREGGGTRVQLSFPAVSAHATPQSGLH